MRIPQPQDMVISGLGVVCPVGLLAANSCAAIRAGIRRIRVFEHICDEPDEGPDDEPRDEDDDALRAAMVPYMPEDIDGRERMLRMALRAMQELVFSCRLTHPQIKRTGLLVAMSEPDPAVTKWGSQRAFVRELGERSGLDGWATVECLQEGAVGVVRLVERARMLLDERHTDACVLLAVDSYLDTERLAWLDAERRLRSARNRDGLIPGEGCVALCLEHRNRAGRVGVKARATVGPSNWAEELHPVHSEHASTGAGLTGALRPLLAREPSPGPGPWVLCNLNGESYRANEWGLVQTRLARQLSPIRELHHPADCIGDAGAALAGLLLAYTCEAWRLGHAPANDAILWVASDDARRAALVVGVPNMMFPEERISWARPSR